jgi:hypothetical protein
MQAKNLEQSNTMGTTKNTKTKIIKNKQNDKKTIADGTNKETKSDNNGVFASCSFSSLGLHQTLCDQFHGNFFCFLNLVF